MCIFNLCPFIERTKPVALIIAVNFCELNAVGSNEDGFKIFFLQRINNITCYLLDVFHEFSILVFNQNFVIIFRSFPHTKNPYSWEISEPKPIIV